MAEQTKKHKLRGFFGAVLKVLLALLAMAAVYTGAVLLQLPDGENAENYVVVEDPEPVTPMQPATMNDVKGLAQLFGAPLPVLPGYAVSGEGRNATHDGAVARVAVLRYEGLTITAVQPASAAPLLMIDGLEVALRNDLTVLSLPAVLARDGDAYCVYLSNANAAYSIYAAHTDEDEFFSVLDKLSWAQ